MHSLQEEKHKLKNENLKLREKNKHLKRVLKSYKRAINTERKVLPDCYCSQKQKLDSGCAFCEVWQSKYT